MKSTVGQLIKLDSGIIVLADENNEPLVAWTLEQFGEFIEKSTKLLTEGSIQL